MKKEKNIDLDIENEIDEEIEENDENISFIDEDNEESNGNFFRKLFFIIILICIILIIYARYIGTSGLFIKEYPIKDSKIPKSFNGLKIVHFTDFHYGETTNLSTLKQLVKEINIEKPDIVVFTGDFFDKSKKLNDSEINNITHELENITNTYGKYFVSGDHDIKFPNYEEIFTNAGFTNLNDKFDIILSKQNESILISGTNYQSDLKYYDELFKNELPIYKINIMHEPDTYDDISLYNYNLILAGHSHNGQINIPIYGPLYTEKGAKKYYKPHYKLNNTDMYISSGIGTTMFNYRLFNRPSFNLYRLVSNS